MSEVNELVLTKAQLEQALESHTDQIKSMVDKANEEAKVAGNASVETRDALNALSEKANEIGERLADLEQRDAPVIERPVSIGEAFTKSDEFKALQERRVSRANMNFKTAIINATGQNQPLVADDRVGPFVSTTPNRFLTIRDLLPVSRTTSNLIQFARESAFTNNAAPQGLDSSPEQYENTTKAESAITFTLKNEPVVTLAHFIPVSKQILDDAPALEGFINNRLLYGLKLKEETQLLKGDGAGGEISGLQQDATAYVPTSPQLTNEIDILRHAVKQAHVAEYRPDFVVLNPSDWYDVEIRKVGSSDDRYVVGDPANGLLAPRLWGLDVIVTNSQTAGTFLIGSRNGAMIFDRMDATVEASLEDSTNFQKNMCTIRAEERLALAIWRTEAFITGSL